MPTVYIKGSCYETPLYDHVLGDKRDSDKDDAWEGGEAPPPKEGGGKGGRGCEVPV